MYNIQYARRMLFLLILLFLSIGLVFTSKVSAANKIPEVRHSVKPLDLSHTPSTEELMAAGQLGGQLYPTEDIQIKDTPLIPTLEKGGKGGFLDKKTKRNNDINLSFGNAIQEWNKHNYKEAVQMFRKHAGDYPDKPVGIGGCSPCRLRCPVQWPLY